MIVGDAPRNITLSSWSGWRRFRRQRSGPIPFLWSAAGVRLADGTLSLTQTYNGRIPRSRLWNHFSLAQSAARSWLHKDH
jgi:hypothetical protein